MKLDTMQKILILLSLAVLSPLVGQSQTRIIDMHIHSYTESDFGEREAPTDHYGVKGSVNAEQHRIETFAAFEQFNIVKAMVSGNPESVKNWKEKDKDNRVIRGILNFLPNDHGMDIVKFEQMVKAGEIEIFGELGPYYSGTTLSDSIWQPYLKICEQYDIPVAVHTGGGDPLGNNSWAPKARLTLGDPYLIEDVLVKYPKLRLYMMHAGGEDWPEHAIRLMAYYPQLYTDVAVLLWVEPNTQRYVTDFLRNIKHAGYLDRVMFGSDQMIWPYAIEKSIDFLNSLDFLTEKDKEGIFYGNAARFLKLKE
ncbi:amidohydrolase family protein [Algoriphagus sp. D3-2-R+10]|uniref:amidohydrolase family protein n=1 Tax=Algoriphagus aurantiacus TaxID=3103948 RepID=UPI002B39F027|nr:amidohydrolase family protein [Algoriphagus sp. D3-2-R+10]MEB2774190.1 amidohydrolase family protein [Algoriphagus sp. D3-2-R+10]